MENTPISGDNQPSDRVRGVALALNIPLGVFGAHRFYVGKVGTGILQLFTVGGFGLWWLYDLILIAAGEFRDSDNRRLVAWSREEREAVEAARQEQLPSGRLAEDMETLQTEMHELVERVDFLERMLTQARERDQLPAAKREEGRGK